MQKEYLIILFFSDETSTLALATLAQMVNSWNLIWIDVCDYHVSCGSSSWFPDSLSLFVFLPKHVFSLVLSCFYLILFAIFCFTDRCIPNVPRSTRSLQRCSVERKPQNVTEMMSYPPLRPEELCSVWTKDCSGQVYQMVNLIQKVHRSK